MDHMHRSGACNASSYSKCCEWHSASALRTCTRRGSGKARDVARRGVAWRGRRPVFGGDDASMCGVKTSRRACLGVTPRMDGDSEGVPRVVML